MDIVQRPVITGPILRPFEIRHDDAPRIGQDIGKDLHAVGHENGIGGRRGRAVGQFEQNPRLYGRRVLLANLILQGTRGKDVAIAFEQRFVGHLLGRAVGRRPGDASGFPLEVHDDVGIEPFGVVEGRLGVGDTDDSVPVVVKQAGAMEGCVAESLNHDPGFFRFQAEAFLEVAQHQIPAASGCVVTAQRAAQHDGFAGDHGGRRMADDGAVFVGHPSHDHGVGVDVRRRDVAIGAHEAGERPRIGATQAFQFGVGQRCRIDADTAFGAAERQVGNGALEGHPEGQGDDLVHGHGRVIADAALGRTAGIVVTAAPGGKGTERTVVHAHHQPGRKCFLWIIQLLEGIRVDVKMLGRLSQAFAGTGKQTGHRNSSRSFRWPEGRPDPAPGPG